MSDFILEAARKVLGEPETSKSPEFGIDIVANDSERLDLRDETGDETVLCLGATVVLGECVSRQSLGLIREMFD